MNNDDDRLASGRRHSPELGRFERSTAPRLTPLQMFLLAFYSLLERGRDNLTEQEFRTFVWILTDRVGEEAARLVVAEALDATREDVA